MCGFAAVIFYIEERLIYRGIEEMQQLTLKKPSKLKKVRKQGFRARMKTRSGQQILKRRRAKGRKRLAL